MEISKQAQTAGDNSTQMQAGVINNYIINGIDEARARSIWKEEYAIACREWTQEAEKIARDRVRQLEEKVMPKMLTYDQSLHFFADPSFQFLLRKAQITAALSEREADYEMLSDLLLQRLEQGENRESRLGISKAIEIIDQLSKEAVVGLAVCYATLHLIPNSENFREGLWAHDKLCEKIIGKQELPGGKKWMEHLDLLSVVRLTPISLGSFKKMKELKPEIFSKYFVSGIKEDSEEYEQIKNEFIQNNMPLTCFVPHTLKPNYVKLNVYEDVDKLVITRNGVDGKTNAVPLTEKQKSVMKRVIDLARKDESKEEQLVSIFMEEWDKFPTLKKLRQWWDVLPNHFTITPIGTAISYAYIHGKEPSIPCWC